jgi:periplasmic protein TonB
MRIVLATLVCLAIGTARESPAQEIIYDPDKNITLPRVLKEVKPSYPPEAMRGKVQGDVKLRCVVATSGRAVEIEVVQSLGATLDRAAAEALAQWEFKPGEKGGKPVPVRITVEMRFVTTP